MKASGTVAFSIKADLPQLICADFFFHPECIYLVMEAAGSQVVNISQEVR